MKTFSVVYEPRVEDPVTVAEFDSREQAETYMKELEVKQPRTSKYCQIFEKKENDV